MGRGLTRVRRLAGGAVFDHLLPLEGVFYALTPCKTSTFCKASKDAAECGRPKFAETPLH